MASVEVDVSDIELSESDELSVRFTSDICLGISGYDGTIEIWSPSVCLGTLRIAEDGAITIISVEKPIIFGVDTTAKKS